MLRFVLIALMVCALDAYAQGRLQSVRESVDSTNLPSTSDNSGSKSTTDDEEGRPFENVTGELLYYAFASPFLVPSALFETIPADASFTPAPYWDGPGYLRSELGKTWNLRLSAENGNDFNGLNRVGARAMLDTGTRLGISTNWDHYVERLSCGCVDELTFGDLMVTYRFVQAPTVQMHAGLGMRALFDHSRVRGGVNFLYGGEFYPFDPIVLAAQAEVGHLKEAFTYRLRGTAGVQWRRAELFVGYDWFHIGGVDLHGPLAGLRLSF